MFHIWSDTELVTLILALYFETMPIVEIFFAAGKRCVWSIHVLKFAASLSSFIISVIDQMWRRTSYDCFFQSLSNLNGAQRYTTMSIYSRLWNAQYTFLYVLFVKLSLDRRWGSDRGMTCSKGPQGRIKPRAAAARTQLCTLGTMGVWLTQPPSWVSQFLWMNCSFMFLFQQLWHPLPTCSTWRRRGRRPVPTAKSLKHTSSQWDNWSRQTGKPFLYHKMWKVFLCIKLYWIKKSQKLILFCCTWGNSEFDPKLKISFQLQSSNVKAVLEIPPLHPAQVQKEKSFKDDSAN